MANDRIPTATPLPGSATIQGTEHYAERFAELHPMHFKLCQGLIFSSIGIGTYLGSATDDVDKNYVSAITRAAASGCNVIDTAINYRFQRSERAIGQALQQLINNGFSREELILCSKGGFIPFDGEYPADPYKWIDENLFQKFIISPEDVHPSGHCMTPMYLLHQLDQSLRNLGVEKLDVYYVHNPETQMSELNEVRYYDALEMAFRALEGAVYDGKIAMYGIATWDGFLESREAGHLMQLERVVETARRAGSEQHHFKMVELPVNLVMTDALTIPNQKVGDSTMTFLEAARALNICVVASASLLQGGLVRNLPVTLQQAIPDQPDDAARALQFTRSVPGVATALVGMQSVDHVTRNMELAALSPMTEDDFNILFGER